MSAAPQLKAPPGACDTHMHIYEAPYETSRLGPPHYADVGVLARALVKAAPERCLWASNWPHPNHNPQPSSAAMLDLLLEWTDDEAARRKILVDNPARLYGF